MSKQPKSIIDLDLPIETQKIDLFNVKSISTTPELELPGAIVEVTPVQSAPLRLESITNCPRCTKPLVPAKSVSGVESTSFLECPECGTLINTYKPTHYQAIFLRRRERYKMSAGGFGSGKSRADIEDVIKHVLLIPNARVCVTARTYPALESTFLKDFYAMFPAKLVKNKNDQKHEMSLTNGSEILFRSFDDPTKLKSMNLTMAVIVEASDVPEKGFDMLQSRVRNTAAMLPYYDAQGNPVMEWVPEKKAYQIKYRVDVRHINLETNPDSGKPPHPARV